MTTTRLARSLRAATTTLSTTPLAVAAALAIIATPAEAQFGPPNTSVGPTLPKSGVIPRDTTHERKVLAQMKAPDGFSMVTFAGPPFAMYPTVVAPSPDGSVYVGVDLNLAQGAVKGRGRVMRLVDSDGDGRADRYTIFADVDSPRGIAVDGNTVYVMHPPHLTAYTDTNGDGIADKTDVLVRDIGFSLDVRSSDHATNNITLGPDGWIYIAVGDNGYLNAKGKDGTTITNRGGALVRVRTDGTGLEAYTIGTRNTYDVGISPLAHAFARDNTNDGRGWNTRFHYLAPGANMGYPSLYLNFSAEHMPSIKDFGGGSGTSGLWIQDPGFPDEWNNTLYTGDWTVNRVFHHLLTPAGASWSVTQRDFMTVPRAIDMSMDDQSNLYVASLIGGVFNYAGDTVGAIVRVSYPGRTPAKALRPASRTDAQLVTALVSANAVHRLWAQRELVRRGTKPATIARLQRLVLDRTRAVDARASALFTLKLLAGVRSHATLQRAAAEPAMREVALRALADDKRKLAGVPVALFVKALDDADLAVRLQAINGLVRLNAREHAAAILPLTTSPDSALAHVAVQALVSLGARDLALGALTASTSSPELRTRARFVLQQMHDPQTVTALVDHMGRNPDAVVRRELLTTLARLYNTAAPWTGDWWGTYPATTGPYFIPATWGESARIRPVLRQALAAATGDDAGRLIDDFVRNRVLPGGARALLVATGAAGDAPRAAIIDALVGNAQLPSAAIPLLTQLDGRGPQFRSAIAELLAGETTIDAQVLPLARAALLDTTNGAALRARLLTALGEMPGDAGRDAMIPIFASVMPRAGTTVVASAPAAAPAPAGPPGVAGDPVEAAWRRWVGDRQRAPQLDHFIALARSSDAANQTLAYAILLQSIRSPRAPQALRDRVAPVIDAAWADPASASRLVHAITVMRVDAQYTDRLQAYRATTPK